MACESGRWSTSLPHEVKTLCDGFRSRRPADLPREPKRLQRATIDCNIKFINTSCGEWNRMSACYDTHVISSKHIVNAQVSIRSPCCRKWFDCAECHAENESHSLKPSLEMIFACKKCKKCFRKDVQEFDDSDEYCPHCDNHFVLEAVEPKARLEVEGEDIRKDSRMIKDERVKPKEMPTIWTLDAATERMG